MIQVARGLVPFAFTLLYGMAAFAAPEAVQKIDTGNTTWLLLSAALVMLMTPGLAFFYGGMVARKNLVSTLLQNYVALAVVGGIHELVLQAIEQERADDLHALVAPASALLQAAISSEF